MLELAATSLLVVAGSCVLLFGGVIIVARLARRALIVLGVPVALGYGLALWWNSSHWPVNDVAVLALALVVGCIIGAALRSGVAVVAFCAAALMRIGYGVGESFAVPLGGLVLALGVGLLAGGAPALPFIAVVTGAYVLTRRPKRSPPPVPG